jgi:3-oxoadipyl-CoA thiolase
MEDAFLIDGIRTPIGNFGGSLSGVRTDDLLAHVLKALMDKFSAVDPSLIEDVIIGCANQAGEDNRNVARMSTLLAGFPFTVPAETINRLCASGMSAVAQAARAVQAGDGNLYIAGGVEGMTRAPYVMSKSAKPFGTDAKLFDSSFGWRFVNPAMEEKYGIDAMGVTAENLADAFHISRADQDQFANWSQQKAVSAQQSGVFSEEIKPISVTVGKRETRIFSVDEFVKPQTTLQGLSELRPAFRKTGTVTAGNASGLNDGAAALLLASSRFLAAHNLAPKVRIAASAVTGAEPRIMGIGPVEATKKVLRKVGIKLNQVDWIEINEAFAAQVLACTRLMGVEDNDPRINPNGGGIALGHPLGMSGARIVLTAANGLQRTAGKYALCTMCVGVGQGYALILERV